MSSDQTIAPDELHGVRGWLLALCFFLMIAVPLLAVMHIAGAWQSVQTAPVLRTTLPAQIIIELGLAAFAAYAGFALYGLRRNAVRVAKAYFITMLAIGAFGLISILLGMLSAPQNADIAALQRLSGPVIVTSLVYMAVFGLCLGYLLLSRRVRATYPPQG